MIKKKSADTWVSTEELSLWLWHRKSQWTWAGTAIARCTLIPCHACLFILILPGEGERGGTGLWRWEVSFFLTVSFRGRFPTFKQDASRALKETYLLKEKIYQKQWKHKHCQALQVSSVTGDENCHPQTHLHLANLPNLIRENLVVGFL